MEQYNPCLYGFNTKTVFLSNCFSQSGQKPRKRVKVDSENESEGKKTGIGFLSRLHVTNLPIRVMCPTSICPLTFWFPDSNLNTLSIFNLKLNRVVEHRLS